MTVIHTILTEQTVQMGRGMASKMTKQYGRGCLFTAVVPRDCHNVTLCTTTVSMRWGFSGREGIN